MNKVRSSGERTSKLDCASGSKLKSYVDSITGDEGFTGSDIVITRSLGALVYCELGVVGVQTRLIIERLQITLIGKIRMIAYIYSVETLAL